MHNYSYSACLTEQYCTYPRSCNSCSYEFLELLTRLHSRGLPPQICGVQPCEETPTNWYLAEVYRNLASVRFLSGEKLFSLLRATFSWPHSSLIMSAVPGSETMNFFLGELIVK